MKTIIVDDEPKAIELLKSYIAHFNVIDLVGSFRNGIKAIEYLSNNPVDLVFLDINMPHISGLTLSKMIVPETRIVFTTAYSEYAVESYEVRAVDYLLKPISLERFSKAMSKILSETPEAENNSDSNILLVKSGSKVFRVNIHDIVFLEKDGNYITYHLSDNNILARESVQQVLDRLPHYFIQTHKSYIINSEKVISIDKDNVMVGDQTIPIGNSFKQAVRDRLLEH